MAEGGISYPASSKEADLKQNLLTSHEAVLQQSMCKLNHYLIFIYPSILNIYRFALCSCRFIEAYERGVDRKLAMWVQESEDLQRPSAEDIIVTCNKKHTQTFTSIYILISTRSNILFEYTMAEELFNLFPPLPYVVPHRHRDRHVM